MDFHLNAMLFEDNIKFLNSYSSLHEMINFRVFCTLRFPRFICLFVLCSVRVDEPNNEIARELMREISDKLKNSDGTKEETVVYFHFWWY